jgi:hypothetical protein
MKKALLIICLLLSSCAGSWDRANTALHVPYTALMVADLGQTLWIVDNPMEYRFTLHGVDFYKPHSEANPFLGKHPSKDEVYAYFIGSYALTTAITYWLPPKWSHAFQGGAISLQIYAVENNYSAGVGFKF